MTQKKERAAILNHLLDLKRKKLSIIFITHDVGQALYIADKVAVMTKGEIVEKGPAEGVFPDPRHPYTKKLFADVPRPHEKWEF